MADTPFDTTFRAVPGEPVVLEPGVVRVTAPNAGPMTFTGTNSYLVGDGALAVIDPGPDDPAHRAALLAAISGRRVSAVLVTHAHIDHAPLARPLAQMLDAPVVAFGDHTRAQSEVMQALTQSADLGGAEGLDTAFATDQQLEDGQSLRAGDFELTALHTPGHLADHLCLALGESGIVFSGDHVMGWATTMVSPPHGDLTQFMASLDLMAARNDRIYYPGHGGAVTEPKAMISWQTAHRKQREAQILDALQTRPATALELAKKIYTEIDPRLIPAAARNVLAHLLDLTTRDQTEAVTPLSADATFILK